MLKNTYEKFGSVSKFFHWIIALAIITQLYLILHRNYMPQDLPLKVTYILLHKSIGMTILILAGLFIIWHLVNAKPRYPKGLNRFAPVAAKLVHRLLFLLMLAMPISGYVMSTASGYKVSWFGFFNWPDLLAKNKDLASFASNSHEYFAYLLLLLLMVHISAAFYHHYFKKDNVLRRMLPFSK